jgi:hypothetical protein
VVKIRKLTSGLVPGVAGAMLGVVMSVMQMEQLVPVHFDVDIMRFQNFAVYMGLVLGVLLALITYSIFMALLMRFQYPASSKLGAWLGAAAGALICFSTNLVLNAFASSFYFVHSDAKSFIFVSLFTAIVGGVFGLVVGFFVTEIGARNLHIR